MLQGVYVKYLLDTNALLYVFSAPTELSARARRIVRDEGDLRVSIVSLWEIAIKQSLGKLRFNMSITRLELLCRERSIQLMPISPVVLERIKTLPDIHRDPFDRLIVAQALEEGLAIITRDRIIPQYPVQTIW